MDKPDFLSQASEIDGFRVVDDVLMYETEIEPLRLVVKVVYCEIYKVPVVYFLAFKRYTLQSVMLVPTDWWFSDTLLSCSDCWTEIFDEKDSFAGAISFEQLPNRPERMIRIHPCQNKHFMKQFESSKNKLRSVLSVLLQPFFRIDPAMTKLINPVWIKLINAHQTRCLSLNVKRNNEFVSTRKQRKRTQQKSSVFRLAFSKAGDLTYNQGTTDRQLWLWVFKIIRIHSSA